MSELLDRFSFDPAKLNSQTMTVLVIVWAMVVVTGVLSITNQTFNQRQRWFWILTIVFLPVVGLLCYLPFSLGKDRPAKLYRGESKK